VSRLLYHAGGITSRLDLPYLRSGALRELRTLPSSTELARQCFGSPRDSVEIP
jgi:hypothetical protein